MYQISDEVVVPQQKGMIIGCNYLNGMLLVELNGGQTVWIRPENVIPVRERTGARSLGWEES